MDTTAEAIIYPIGRYQEPEQLSKEVLDESLVQISQLPRYLDALIENLSAEQLQSCYREGSWNMTEVIHHIADVNINMFTRIKLTLTEDNAHIVPFDENKWATMPDVYIEPVNISITLLHCLHRRIVSCLHNCSDSDWRRTHYHPGLRQDVSLGQLVHKMAWHGMHHFSQLHHMRLRNGW